MNKIGRIISACAVALGLPGCMTLEPGAGRRSLAPGDIYVAIGSSFAAGPGISKPADTPPTRCARSIDNYAHQLARKKGLRLIDVSCSAATTAHLLGPWSELPPQLDALTPDTSLITATIGGNDMGYIGGIMAASCQPMNGKACMTVPEPTEQKWQKLEADMRKLLAEMRRRAPNARIILVDYPTVLPDHGQCAAAPLSPEQADRSRMIASRLAALTAKVAHDAGAEILAASSLSRGHDACAADPWMNGFIKATGSSSFAPYHPNLAGMTAVADALERMTSKSLSR
ncbi:SGNH/GDSL hydrolase family protein [Sphingobium tyrosinilyticum]